MSWTESENKTQLSWNETQFSVISTYKTVNQDRQEAVVQRASLHDDFNDEALLPRSRPPHPGHHRPLPLAPHLQGGKCRKVWQGQAV